MRIVVDTNIFVSAAIKESSWSAMVIRWVDCHGSLLKSIVTEAEVMEVLQRPRFALLIPPLFVHNVRRMLAAAELVTITEQVKECRDPKDDKFLELAWNGRAEVMVSGDTDLLTLRGCLKTKLLIKIANFSMNAFPPPLWGRARVGGKRAGVYGTTGFR